VKLNRFGQATPLTHRTYQLISNQFLTSSHKLFWALAWYTGERPETILSMLVDHAYSNPAKNLPRTTILFPAVNRKGKTDTREVPCHQSLELVLKNYDAPSTGWLFPSLYRDDRHLSRQAMDRALRRALKKAGLADQGFSLYSPRRGFITRLDELGYSMRMIQAITGHRSLAALGKYIEVSDEKKRSVIEAF
jgi:integrase/recombinase XerD